MGIELEYDGVDSIPEMSVKELFTEKEGKMVFTGIEGMKTQKDVDSLQEALRKERNDHGQLKESFKLFDGLDADLARKAIEENEVLKLKQKDGINSEEVQRYLKDKLDSGLSDSKKTIEELTNQLNEYKFKEEKASHTSFINGLVKDSVAEDMVDLVAMNLLSMSEKDLAGEYVTNGSGGFEKGLPLKGVVASMLEKNPRLMKQNTSGNGTGGTGGNTPDKSKRLADLQKKVGDGSATHQEKQEMFKLAREMQAK